MSTPTSLQIPVENAAHPAPGSLPVRIGQLFFSPGKLFESFREHAPWGGTLLAASLAFLAVQVVAMYALISDQMFADYTRQALIEAGAGQIPPDEQLLQMAKINKIVGVIGAPIGVAVAVFFTSLAAWMMFSVMGGGKARYGQYVAVISHAVFISLLGALVLLPLQTATGQLEMSLSPALFLDEPDRTSFLFRALDKLSVFTIWSMVVVGIGVAAVNRKKNWALYATALLAVYILFTAGIPTLLGMFLGAAQTS